MRGIASGIVSIAPLLATPGILTNSNFIRDGGFLQFVCRGCNSANAELQKFTVDTWRTPRRAFAAHGPSGAEPAT
jgi:hypothetical protein